MTTGQDGGDGLVKLEIQEDLIAEKLDEMADISKYWKKHRDKGRSPNAIRAAMLILCEECVFLARDHLDRNQKCEKSR